MIAWRDLDGIASASEDGRLSQLPRRTKTQRGRIEIGVANHRDAAPARERRWLPRTEAAAINVEPKTLAAPDQSAL